MYQDYMGDGRTKHKSLRSSLVPTRILVLASQLFLSIICKKKLDLHTIFLSFFFFFVQMELLMCAPKRKLARVLLDQGPRSNCVHRLGSS